MTPAEFQDKFNEAWRLRSQGNYNKVMQIAEEYLQISRENRDRASEALFLKIYAQVHSDKNELSKSLALYKQIEEIYIELELKSQQMHTLRHIGMIYQELGESECAEKCLKQVIDSYAANPPNDLEVANAERLYAITMEALREKENAIRYWESAQTRYGNVGIQEGVDECQDHLDLLKS